MSLKKTILKYFPIDRYLSLKSYSQEGEDMVLRSFFEGQKNYKGFFVDVGAHHPYRFSNTLHFYKKGWRGINIDPQPGMQALGEGHPPKLAWRRPDCRHVPVCRLAALG